MVETASLASLKSAASAVRQSFDVALAWPARSLLRQMARMLGAPRAFAPADRRLLEDCILPHYAKSDRALDVLFVGTRWYTRSYERIFERHRFLTMDIDARAARHGSSQGHITACTTRVDAYFEPGSLDLIVLNGVFGWGLDERAEVETAVVGFHRALRAGGAMLVGWNDVAGHRPFPFGELHALQAFVRVPFEPLGLPVIELPGSNRHRFEFFRKPAAGRAIDAR